MSQPAPSPSPPPIGKSLEALGSWCEGRTRLLHKHAVRWNRVHFWLGIPSTTAATIAGATSLGAFPYHEVIAALLAILAAALTALQTFLNPNQRATEYEEYSRKFNALCSDIRLYARYEHQEQSYPDVIKRVKELNERLHALDQESPILMEIYSTPANKPKS